jgi:hypothetical protein
MADEGGSRQVGFGVQRERREEVGLTFSGWNRGAFVNILGLTDVDEILKRP